MDRQVVHAERRDDKEPGGGDGGEEEGDGRRAAVLHRKQERQNARRQPHGRRRPFGEDGGQRFGEAFYGGDDGDGRGERAVAQDGADADDDDD